MLVLRDADVRRAITMGEAVQAMRSALLSRAAGTLISAERTGIAIGGAGLVWTPGGFLDDMTMGLRLYPTGTGHGEQLVALWDARTGELRCVAAGAELGRLRTGAIGGVAMDLLARPEAAVLGVIGAGAQAEQQVQAALAVRRIRRVQVYRRSAAELRGTAAAWTQRLGVEVVAAESARAAVTGADIVVTATSAAAPIVEAAWLEPGTHVNALGPKYRGRQEIGLDLVRRAQRIACDFPEQYRGEEDFFLHGTPDLGRMQDLAQLVSAGASRGGEDVTLFLSHGLAGTEVRLLAAVWEKARRLGIGQEIAL